MDSAERVLELEDLDRAILPPVPLAVLGDPIAHSLSPAMHNAALGGLAQEEPAFADWRYMPLRVPIERLAEAVKRLHSKGFRGINLTLPHKIRAVDLVTEVAVEARAVGAVNTLVAHSGGYSGTNTDGYGISRAVEETLGRKLKEGPLILCGAGGAARAIAVQALSDGVPALWLGNRGSSNLEQLLAQLRIAGFDLSSVRSFLFSDLPRDLPSNALLINATASGLKADQALPLDLGFLGREAAIYDTTYGVTNAWARFAAEKGLAYGDGLSMLVAQGVRSLEIWTGRKVSARLMETAARAALAQRSHAS